MMTMWARFARTGNPNVKGLVNWPAYEAASDQYLYITEALEVKTGFSKIKKL
jgi:carboxylesterase type B